MILFISISKWKGMAYYRSQDPEDKRVGMIAIALLAISTLAVVWYSYILTTHQIQSSLDSINADLNF